MTEDRVTVEENGDFTEIHIDGVPEHENVAIEHTEDGPRIIVPTHEDAQAQEAHRDSPMKIMTLDLFTHEDLPEE